MGGLPIELAKRGHRVYSIAPRYDQYKVSINTLSPPPLPREEEGYPANHMIKLFCQQPVHSRETEIN